MKLFKTNYWCC